MSTHWSPRGVLAIWNDCADGREDIYEEWYLHEHLRERLGVSGFRVGRRYEATRADRQFLTTYEVDRPEVLSSSDYLARLANPTELTELVMRDGFINASRTICKRTFMRGSMRSANLLAIAIDDYESFELLQETAQRFPIGASVTHTEIWESVHPDSARESAEMDLRGPDSVISACLAVEFLREKPALAAADMVCGTLPGATIGVYRLLGSLRKEDLVNGAG